MANQNYARIGQDSMSNIVLETWRAPDDLPDLNPSMIFVPWLVAEFVACPDEVLRNWVYDPIAKTYAPQQEDIA